ncbi:MAG: hypothetical protein ABL311_04575 [Nitratireductor rhodophyticola]|uniref:hypothetical protein n=1 Tax=Nitratireductor rhodophyticola TaxID=2854036 RepID=UPI0032D8CB6F
MSDEHKWAERAFDRQDELQTEIMRASIADSKEAIRAALILNGAACIAILGFVASVIGGDSGNASHPMTVAAKIGLRWFAVGALFAALTSGLAYLCNSLYAGAAADMSRHFDHPHIRSTPIAEKKQFWAVLINWVAVATITFSYVLFGVGLFKISANF